MEGKGREWNAREGGEERSKVLGFSEQFATSAWSYMRAHTEAVHHFVLNTMASDGISRLFKS